MNASTVILTSLVTSLLTAVGTVYVVERYDILPRPVPAVIESIVPKLEGLTEADARSSAGAAELALTVAAEEATTEAKPGTVLRQTPPVGQRVSPKSVVSVVVARELPKVPELTGLTMDLATQRLKTAGYTVQIAGEVADAKVPQGQIARQMPSAESAYVKGAAVTVQLSSGPAEVEVPKLLGKPFLEAQKQAEAVGLKPVVVWVSVAETTEYVVLQQAPAAGAKLAPGAEVRLTVNR